MFEVAHLVLEQRLLSSSNRIENLVEKEIGLARPDPR